MDDEFSVLKGIERVLSTKFDVTAVANAADATLALQYAGSFAVIVSDFRLIETDGVRLLARAAEIAPTTVRLLLTGHAGMEDAISAINDGHVFGYVSKPCRPELLIQRVTDAVAQHDLLVDEKALLEDTLKGAIKALMDLLAVTCPTASGRAMRMARYAALLAAELRVDAWNIEMAAMLSQVGCVTIAHDLAERICHGSELSEEEQRAADRLPLVAERILAAIPRVDGIRAILLRIAEPWTPGMATGSLLGARILRVVGDFDRFESRGDPVAAVLARLAASARTYDPAVVAALATVARFIGSGVETVEMLLSQVETGMIVASDVRNPLGILLIARGQDVTAGIHERIVNHWTPFAERLMVRVIGAPMLT